MLIDRIDALKIIGLAGDGQEAIEQVTRLRPDFLILDLHMPKVNGFDVLKHLHEHQPKTGVIIISMFGDPSIHREAVRHGVKGYLLKHADQDEFIMAMELILKGKCYYSPEIFEEQPHCVSMPNGTSVIPMVPLTKREEEVLSLIATGLTNKEIAGKLFVSPKTVDSHRTNLMKKIHVHNVTGLVRYALVNGYEV